MEEGFCSECGERVRRDARFCRSCGHRLDEAAGRDGAARSKPGSPRRRGRGIAILIGLSVVLAGAAVAAALLLSKDEAEAPEPVVLEPVGYAPRASFFGNLDADPRAARRAARQAARGLPAVGAIDDPRSHGVEATLSGRVVEGTDPAFYGGTRDTRVCDSEALIRSLSAPGSEQRSELWSEAVGADPRDTRDYVESLTALRLGFDTRVTGHTFEDGVASSFQSILQAGTAVLVDPLGVPRVKCNGGNPLGPPVGLESEESVGRREALDLTALAENPAQAWRSFNPRQVTTVAPAVQPAEDFTLVDLENPEGLLERGIGSDGASSRDTGTGDVKVTLDWSSTPDIDLHVIEPSGEEIWFAHEGPSRTGGRLDVDANVGCRENGSLENVFWPLGAAPTGRFIVKVVGYRVAGCGSGAYELTIQVAGAEPRVIRGTVGEKEEDVYRFSSSGNGDFFEEEDSDVAADDGSYDYVALGDSFSAGEGIGDYFDGGNRCHRSQSAYATEIEHPGLVGTTLFELAEDGGPVGTSWGFQACSGATTAAVLHHGWHEDPLAQLEQSRDSDRNPHDQPVDEGTDLVTLTIGGNDLGFSDVLQFCGDPRGLSNFNCTNNDWPGSGHPVEDELRMRRDALSGKLDDVFRRIRAQAPGARILVGGYPQLFPASSREQGCFQLGVFSRAEQNFMRGEVSRANQLIAARTEAADDVEFVPVDGYFAGHEVCGDRGAWINGASLTTDGGIRVKEQSFHPTAVGQRMGYAAAFNDALQASDAE